MAVNYKGSNQIATVWQIKEENLHVFWYDNGRKSGKMVSSNSILQFIERPTSKHRYKLYLFVTILVFFIILFITAAFDRYENRLLVIYLEKFLNIFFLIINDLLLKRSLKVARDRETIIGFGILNVMMISAFLRFIKL